jgi:hypothetical protein
MPIMKSVFSTIVLVLALTSAHSADRFTREPQQISIATTGRIQRIDLTNKTFEVRGSDAPSILNVSHMVQTLRQRIVFSFPGGFTFSFPGFGAKHPKTENENANDLDEYTVVITNDTVIQDGAEPIELEDFRVGEMISIHGVLRGNTLTASRIAKWF